MLLEDGCKFGASNVKADCARAITGQWSSAVQISGDHAKVPPEGRARYDGRPSSAMECASCKRTLEKAKFSKSQQGKGAARRCKGCCEGRSGEAVELFQSVLDDKTMSQASRDLAMMRMCEPMPLPETVRRGDREHISTMNEDDQVLKGEARSGRTEEQYQETKDSAKSADAFMLWGQVVVLEMSRISPAKRAEMLERHGKIPTEHEAVSAAAHSSMLNETMCSPKVAPVSSRPGHFSAFEGMPALAAAAQRIASDKGESDVARADACCVLSYLECCNRPPDNKKAIKTLTRAIKLRPNSGLQFDRRAGLHAANGDFPSALADLVRARSLFDGPHAAHLRHEATGNIGKCYHQLEQSQKAIPELEKYVEAAFSGPLETVLTDRDRGHAIVAQYFLVELLGNSGKRAEARVESRAYG